jgi:DNA-binding IclR family transcriptional regulator
VTEVAGVKLNQSVQKAAAVLRAAGSETNGDTASGLARRAGLPWATAARLIRTLEGEGFLFRVPETDRYVLGFEFLRIAQAGDPGNLLSALSRPALEGLADEVGETVNLAVVRSDGRLEVVLQADPPRMLVAAPIMGNWEALHASAIGKLFLSTYDEAHLAEYLSQPLTAYTPATITAPDVLRKELASVQERGWSDAVDELEEGLAAISVGVRHCEGELVGIVSVAGPSSRFDTAARTSALGPTREASSAIEQLVAGER